MAKKPTKENMKTEAAPVMTVAQKKLPPALQAAILKKAKKK